MYNYIKNHISGLSTIIAATVAIITATIAFETRYASAKDVQSLRIETIEMTNKIQIENQRSVDKLRHQQLEDKIFEIRIRNSKNPVDDALLKRYEQQLKDVSDRLNTR